MRKKRTPPFSLRLTFEQRARLEQEAAGSSLSAYIHERLFGAEAPPARRRRGKSPVRDQQAIAELLAKLGQSRLSSNLNQLARLANLGALPVRRGNVASAARRGSGRRNADAILNGSRAVAALSCPVLPMCLTFPLPVSTTPNGTTFS